MIWEHSWALALLVLVPVLAILGLRSRAPFASPGMRRLTAVFHAAAGAALILALAGPHRSSQDTSPVRVVLALPDADASLAASWREATPFGDEFRIVTAGAQPSVGERGDTSAPAADGAPDLSAALAASLLEATPGQPIDIAILGTAGHVRPSLAASAQALAQPGVRLHARTTPPVDAGPVLLDVDHPARVGRREPFRAVLAVRAPEPLLARIRILDRRSGTLLTERDAPLRSGSQALFCDVPPLPDEGVVRLAFEVVPAGAESAAAAGREETAILVDGSPRVLWLGASDEARDALRATLAPHGLEIDTAAAAAPFGSDPADSWDVVLVDDLPADGWPAAAQAELAAAVVDRGTGVLLAGAHRSLGPGGYADSPLAPILPVDFPQREERRDPSVSLVLVIDTSGSMGNRIELAKEVARLALRRLLPHDKAGIVEFYGSKRWAAPLQPASNTIELMRALNRMQAGGGTVIYSALEESYYALLNAPTRFKHILVLTDGGVESGPFEALARRIGSSGIQLSTVLIGPQANSPFLMNLAQWGRGRFYAAPSRFQLPELRFKEPQTTLMPSVQERPFGITATAPWESTRALGDARATLGGLVEAQGRLGAEELLSATDGGQPVLAAWDQGAGRAAILATELLGPMTDSVREAGWATLLADQIRALARGREALRPTLRVEAQPRGARVTLHDAERPAWPLPELAFEEVDGTASGTVALTPTADGASFVAEVPWPESGALRFSVPAASGEPATGAAAAPAPREARLHDVSDAVRRLVTATDGTLEGPLPHAAPPSPAGAVSRTPLRPTLALVAALAFLAAVLARRWPGRAAQAAIALLALSLLPTHGVAQQLSEDPIQARIDAELRRTGNLDALRAAWKDGSEEQRLALAREIGDIDALLELTRDRPAHRALRALVLEAGGNLEDALLEVRTLAQEAPDVDRGGWILREAELLASLGRTADARASFRRAAAAFDDPAYAHAIGHLAASYGLFDVALELHVPTPDAADAARTATFLRRARYCEALGDDDGAIENYRAAADAAPQRREKRFALTRMLATTKAAGRLEKLVADWTRELDQLDVDRRAALLDALRELDRGDDALVLLDRPELQSDASLQAEALSIAIESGRTDDAVARAQQRLAAAPDQPRLRVSLALLLTDLRRRDEASAVLVEGMERASRRELQLLVEAASELGDEAAFAAGLARIRQRGEERDQLDAVLLEADHLRRRQRFDLAVAVLEGSRGLATTPTAKVRLAEALESASRTTAAIALYREAYEATQTEDLGLRLAWLLSSSRDAAERAQSSELFRRIWLEAGSAARRVQAEERVLDLAAREGKLADLAIELEEALDDPTTEHRDQKREALVKIWARAQDTFGAREVLERWIRDEPSREVEARQRLAQIYLENEEFRNHERTLRQLIDLDPEAELDYRQQIALGFLERGRPVEARAVIREMLDGGGNPDAIAFEFSAGIFSLAGRHREAADLYRRALALHPDRIETLLLWANAMAAQNRADEAVARFADILMRESEGIADDLFLVAVDGLLNLEAPKPVLRLADRALRRRIAAQPDKVFLRRARQDVLEMLGDQEARLASLEETLLVAGLQRTTWLREAMEESAKRRDWPSYLADARALLETGDEVPPAVFLEIGEALLQTGELRAAERAFARARLATDFAKVENRIAELFEKAGRIEDAERVRRRVLRRDPTNPSALFAIARLVEQRGDRADALALYRDAAQLLFQGQDLEAEAQPSRSSRNQTSTGPGFDDAVDGALRCAAEAGDLAPLRDDLERRFAKAEDASATARIGLITQMRRLVEAWPDRAEAERLSDLEDAILAESGEGVDDRLRLRVVQERLARGELDRAARALEAVKTDAGFVRARIALLRGDREEALRLALTATDARTQLETGRALILAGADEEFAALRASLQARAAEDDGAARTLESLQRMLGEEVDPRPGLDLMVRQAREASGSLSQRVSRLTSALRNHTFLTDAERGDLLAPLAREAAASKDGLAAWSIVSAARGWLPAEDLAPLVPLLFDDQQQIYQVTSRAAYLDLMPADEAAKLLDKTLGRFDAAEVRNALLRMLANQDLPPTLHAAMLSGIRLSELQPSDRTWLSRVVTQGRQPRETSELLLRTMRRDRPEDPQTDLLAAQIETDTDARRTLLRRAADRLSATAQVDGATGTAIDCLAELCDGTLREELLARTEAGLAAARLVRAALLGAAGRAEDSADQYLEVVRADPANTALVFQAQALLLALGRREDAIEVYAKHLDAISQVYPFHAGQLARLYVDAGQPEAALAALRRAEDEGGTNLDVWLRAAVSLDDDEARVREIRAWAQARQRIQRRSAGLRINFNPMARAQRWTLSDVLTADGSPRPLPAVASEAEEEGDLLSFVPEGAALAESLLRCIPGAQRDAALSLYRGLLGSEARFGDVEPRLADRDQRLASTPFDAEALRVSLAADQLGLPSAAETIARTALLRGTDPQVDPGTWIDLLWTAERAGQPDLVKRMLAFTLRDRALLSRFEVRDRAGDVFHLAARHSPRLLLTLAPVGTSPNAYFDGDLLAELSLGEQDADSIVQAFAPIDGHLRGSNRYGDTRIALPWAGVCIRTGDIERAVEALMVDDSQNDTGDLVPARNFAAAVPPLSLWKDPTLAVPFAERLAGAAAEARGNGMRGVLVRTGLLVAARLDEAGRKDDAVRVRAALREQAGLVPYAASWLQLPAR